ncbi:MAG: disulfide bond formation protein DsbA, partial [Bowdeniella nasicola]|nr:disulfide bond formation protein DsbA [Bowdeniella nasicola]
DEALLAEALVACGLPEKLAAAANVDVYDQALRQSTQAAIDMVGDDVGVPTIAIDGVALFGPVVSPAPRGDDALALWDGYVKMVRVPGFFELKRSRNVGPIFHTED